MARFPAIVKNDSRFNRLVAFVPEALEEFSRSPDRLAVFCHFSHLSESEAKNLMTNPLSQPFIDIKDLRINTSGLRALGRFDPDYPKRIALDKEMTLQFQIDHNMELACETVLAATLHECVHFGRQKKGVPDPKYPESGVELEKKIWNKHHGKWFDTVSIDTAVPDNTMLVFPVTGETGRLNHLYGQGVRGTGSTDHYGIDIFHTGSGHPPVYAAADGVVMVGDRFRKGEEFRNETAGYGQMVDLNHGNGILTRYAHLESVEVFPGQKVRQGNQIGTLGATGTRRGAALEKGDPAPVDAALPHLHFEIRKTAGSVFGSFESTLDPIDYYAFLSDRPENRIVRALTPGKPLEIPACFPVADENRLPTGNDLPAFPNSQAGPEDPRGIRNNNPGNIRRNQTKWKGLRPLDEQLDPDFFQFTEMKWGIRAVSRILSNYRSKHGVLSIAQMASRWAPSDDGNHPIEYAKTVLALYQGQASNIHEEINLSDRDVQFDIIRGILVAENGWSDNGRLGADSVSNEAVTEGIELA